MFSFNGEVLVIPSRQSTLFSDVVRRLVEKWDQLPRSRLSFHYSIGEYNNCSMSNDNDFYAMMCLINEFSPIRVDVDILYNKQQGGVQN